MAEDHGGTDLLSLPTQRRMKTDYKRTGVRRGASTWTTTHATK